MRQPFAICKMLVPLKVGGYEGKNGREWGLQLRFASQFLHHGYDFDLGICTVGLLQATPFLRSIARCTTVCLRPSTRKLFVCALARTDACANLPSGLGQDVLSANDSLYRLYLKV